MPNPYIHNTYVLMWILSILIVYNVVLAFKQDGRTELLSSIVMILGLLGVLYGMSVVFGESGNPTIVSYSEKLFFLIALTVGCRPSLFYAMFGLLLVKTVKFFSKPVVS